MIVGCLSMPHVFKKSELSTYIDIDFSLINVNLRTTGEKKTTKHAVLKKLDVTVVLMQKLLTLSYHSPQGCHP